MNATKLRDSDIVSAFLYCDDNHDNHINLQECREALRYIGYSMTLAGLKKLFTEKYSQVDTDKIKLRESIELARNSELPTGEASRSEIANVFKILDKDKDGLVQVKDLRKFVTTHGEEPLSEEEFRIVMKGMNEDEARISNEDFQNIMKPMLRSLVGKECSLITYELMQELDKH